MEGKDKQKIGLVLLSGDTALSLRFCSSISRLAKSSGVALFVFAGGMPTKEQLQCPYFSSVILFADPCLFEESDTIDLSLFGSTPCILVNFRQKGFSSLTCDLYPAARKLLQHCLDGKRQIACIQGPAHNELAQQSFQAYRDTLAENNLPLDFKLVSDLGLTELIDRALVPGIDFDAIYCFGSEQALDIGMQLQARLFDIQIVGCVTRGGSPLPSIILPISQMTLPAWEMALSEVPCDRVFDCEVSFSTSFLQEDLFSNKQELLSTVVQTYDLDAVQAETILQFIDTCTHLNESMFSSLKSLSSLFLEEGGAPVLLQELLLGFTLQSKTESLFLQLAYHASQVQASLHYRQQTLFAWIQKAMDDHWQQSSKILSEHLPLLGIHSCYIVQQQLRRRVVAGFHATELISEEQSLPFDNELLPPTLGPLLNDSCWLQIPLNQENKTGYMLLETTGCQPETLVVLKALFSPLILSEYPQGPDKYVVAIGDGPGEIALRLSSARKILLHKDDEFFSALQNARPSLLIVDSVDIPFFNRVRSMAATSLTPIVLVKDSFSPQDAEDVLLIPRFIMVHTSVAMSRSFLVRLASVCAGEGEDISTMTAALVKGAIVYIDEHVETQFSRWELAEAVNASEDYLGRIFRKEMGLSLWDYLHMHRVAIATEMLKQTPLTITEIANKTGFKDLAYFSRVFKSVMGYSPSQVRSQKP